MTAQARRSPNKPNWGHGPKPPVRTFTLAEIQAALRTHGPIADTYDEQPELRCACSHAAATWPDGTPKFSFVDWTDEHFLQALKGEL